MPQSIAKQDTCLTSHNVYFATLYIAIGVDWYYLLNGGVLGVWPILMDLSVRYTPAHRNGMSGCTALDPLIVFL